MPASLKKLLIKTLVPQTLFIFTNLLNSSSFATEDISVRSLLFFGTL